MLYNTSTEVCRTPGPTAYLILAKNNSLQKQASLFLYNSLAVLAWHNQTLMHPNKFQRHITYNKFFSVQLTDALIQLSIRIYIYVCISILNHRVC